MLQFFPPFIIVIEVLACFLAKFLSTLFIQIVVSHFFSGYNNFMIPFMMSEAVHQSLTADHFFKKCFPSSSCCKISILTSKVIFSLSTYIETLALTLTPVINHDRSISFSRTWNNDRKWDYGPETPNRLVRPFKVKSIQSAKSALVSDNFIELSEQLFLKCITIGQHYIKFINMNIYKEEHCHKLVLKELCL